MSELSENKSHRTKVQRQFNASLLTEYRIPPLDDPKPEPPYSYINDEGKIMWVAHIKIFSIPGSAPGIIGKN